MIQATVASPNPSTNTATISHADQFDPVTANNTDRVVVTPQLADLTLAKSVSNPTPNVGETIAYIITLTDNAPDAATNVQTTDVLPSGLSFVSATPSQGAYNPVTGLWNVGTVSVGSLVTLRVQATVVSPDPTTNTATITHADQFDPNPGNNTASIGVIPQQADLALSKIVSDPTPNVGDTISYTITLANNGPNDATNVAISDALPAGSVLISASTSVGNYDGGTGVWTVGNEPIGTSQTLQITARVTSPDDATNRAAITHADQFDPNPGNNTATATQTPQQADLALTKTVNDTTPNVGDTITYTITLSNNGPDPATSTQVTDPLASGLTFVSDTPSQGTYDSGTGLWSVGTVNVGSPATLLIQATVVSAESQTNTATITHADQFDPNPGNNTATATQTPQQADLALTKTVNDTTPNVGDTITYTITLSNNGPDPATSTQVTDPLASGLTFVSDTPSQGTYDSGTGLWSVGTVNVGSPATLLIQATVVSAESQTNTATITHADQFDPNPGNNTATAPDSPQQADLVLTKTVNNSSPNVNDTITFTIVLQISARTTLRMSASRMCYRRAWRSSRTRRARGRMTPVPACGAWGR